MSTNLSSGLLHAKHQGQGCEDNLDDTINTCSKEAGRCTRKANTLKDLSTQDQFPIS